MSEAVNVDQVARKDFPISFRGFDQHEVRAYLAQLAEAIASWHEREARLLARIEELEHAPPPEITDEMLEAALGREATRIIHAAREAAVEMQAKAEALYRAREAESEALLSTKRAELEEQATAVIDAATQKADAVLSEATSKRDALLDDLEGRRATLIVELRRLHSARQRVVSTFEAARGALDQSLTEVVDADNAAAEVTRKQVAIDPVIVPEVAPAPRAVDRAPAVTPASAPPSEGAASSAPEVEDERQSSSLRLVRPAGFTPVAPGDDDGVEGVRIIRATAESAPEGDPVPASTAPELASEPIVEPEPEPESEAEAEAEPIVTPEPEPGSSLVVASEPEPDTVDDGEPQAVEGLFARLRADRAEKVATAEAILAGPLPAPEPVAAATPVEPEPEPEPAVTTGDLTPFTVRDAAVADAERGVIRSLKRALADEQNEVLDQLRRLKGRPAIDALLPDVAVHVARYGAVLGTGASAAAVAADADGSSGAEVADKLGADVAADLRLRIERAIDDASGDVETLAEAISSAYREWKTARAEPLARDLITAGYAAGTYAAADGELRWVVDPAEGGCPDCDDNALAGPTPKGTTFPTGQKHPPAHAGCRCLAVPAS